MNKCVSLNTVWACIGLVGWAMPWIIFSPPGGKTESIWGYEVGTGFQNGIFVPGAIVPIVLLACVFTGIWVTIQFKSRIARVVVLLTAFTAACVAIAHGLIAFRFIQLATEPVSAGMGAYILLISGGLLMLSCISLHTKVNSFSGSTEPDSQERGCDE